jgi:hypothetical protein
MVEVRYRSAYNKGNDSRSKQNTKIEEHLVQGV